MTEQIQCICKPKCKCAAHPNYTWASKLESQRIELFNKRQREKQVISQQLNQHLVDKIRALIQDAVSKEKDEITVEDRIFSGFTMRTLRKEYFVDLDQVEDSRRFKFKFLV